MEARAQDGAPGSREPHNDGGQEHRPPSHHAARFGYTVTKKIGNAVTRNRIRRRLKAAIAALAPAHAVSGLDYVVVARHGADAKPFTDLERDLKSCLERIARSARKPPQTIASQPKSAKT